MAEMLNRIEWLKGRLAGAPVVGSKERTEILLKIMELQKRVLEIREAAL